MTTGKNFWKHLALFLSGAMFWGSIVHMYLAVKKFETITFGIKIGADENWLGAGFHLLMALFFFWLYKRSPEKSESFFRKLGFQGNGHQTHHDRY